MCGISGIIKKSTEPVTKTELKAITDVITHRGPDDEGYYTNGNLGFGHRRLSILDLSSDGHQPMHYLDKYVLTYNGEIYNYLELKNELIKQGYTFKSKTDSEVIIAAYDYWGEECTHEFNGMWAFAIYDKIRNVVFCSRDRFGVKPFYYFEKSNVFAFGSEIKVFTAIKEWHAALNIPRAIDFLTFSIFDHTSETLFKNVYQLRGGHNLTYDLQKNTYQIKQWYNISSRIKADTADLNTKKQNLRSLFEDAVKLRLRSDVKVGSCLSGGIDSSAIVGVMNQFLTKNGKTEVQEVVSSCFAEKKFDEQEFIDEVVAKTGVKSHKVFPDFKDLFNQLQHIIWHQDEPFGSTSIYAQWNVFEEAKKQGLKVMLDGQGADESLAGYPYFQDVYHVSLLKNLKIGKLKKELEQTAALQNKSTNKRNEFYKLAFKAFIPAKATELLRKQSSSHHLNYVKNSVKNTFKIYKPHISVSMQSHSLDLINVSHLPMLLHYEDRDSMAHSIESRVPFLDYRLVEFVLSLPDEYKINKGVSKFILREALADVLPEKIKNRHDKMGFVTPEQLWILNNKDLLRSYLKDAVYYFKHLIHSDQILADFDHAIAKDSLSFGSVFWRIIVLHQWALTFKVDCALQA